MSRIGPALPVAGAVLALLAGPVAAETPARLLSGLYLAARHATAQHDYGRATMLLDAVLAGDPASLDVLRSAFNLAVSAGQIDTAVALAPRIQAFNPADELALSVRVLADIREGRYGSARDGLQLIPGAGLSRLVVPLIGAWAEAGLGQRETALTALSGLAGEPAFRVLGTLHRAMVLDYLGDAAGAESAYAEAAARNLSGRTVQLIGGFFERSGASDRARALYQQYQADVLVAEALARLDAGGPPPAVPNPAEGVAQALFGVAGLLMQQNANEAALIYARFVPYLDPGLVQGQVLIAGLLANLGQPEQALAVYQALAAAGGPVARNAEVQSALMMNALDRQADALDVLQRLVAVDPQRTDALVAIGDVHRRAGAFAEAVDAYDRAIAAGAGDWRSLYKRSLAFTGLDRLAEAEADLMAALELSPDQAMLLNALGYMWADKGVNLDRALALAVRADQLQPNDGAIIDSIGWAHYRLGHLTEAQAALERAILLEPEDPVINDHLGDLYWAIGRRIEAGFQWRRALRHAEETAAPLLRQKIESGLPAAPPSREAVVLPDHPSAGLL